MAQEQLNNFQLTKDQMSFFILHGELDKGHSHDILDVLENASLTPYEWAWCEYAAECTMNLYKALYNHSVEHASRLCFIITPFFLFDQLNNLITMNNCIQTAASADKKKALFNFRYRIYIEEMNKYHLDADHLQKQMTDESDSFAVQFFVENDNGIIGTARLQNGSEGIFASKDIEFFNINSF